MSALLVRPGNLVRVGASLASCGCSLCSSAPDISPEIAQLCQGKTIVDLKSFQPPITQFVGSDEAECILGTSGVGLLSTMALLLVLCVCVCVCVCIQNQYTRALSLVAGRMTQSMAEMATISSLGFLEKITWREAVESTRSTLEVATIGCLVTNRVRRANK